MLNPAALQATAPIDLDVGGLTVHLEPGQEIEFADLVWTDQLVDAWVDGRLAARPPRTWTDGL